MTQVIKVSGKARQVFKYIKLLAEKQGDKTLGQIIQEKGGYYGLSTEVQQSNS